MNASSFYLKILRSICGFIITWSLLVILSLVGCGKKEAEPIKIGATFPLTGANATYGEHLKNAIEIRKDQINSQGGIGGKMIDVVYLDDANDPKQSVSNLQNFINLHHVAAVIGSAGSNCSAAMLPIANSSKAVMISPTSSDDALSQEGSFFFRTCPTDAYQAVIISKWIKDEGHNTVGIFHVNNSWGVGLKNRFVQEFEKLGGKIVTVETGEELADDFRTQLAKLKQANPEALFMPTYAKQGGRIVKQAKELKIALPMYGGDPWDVPDFLTTAGSAAEGAKYTVFKQYTGKEYQQLADEYKKRYGKEADFLAASGYDCMLVLGEAMKKVSADGKEITGENIQAALRGLEVVGATGTNKFDGSGDVVGKEFQRNVVKSQTRVSIAQ